MHKLIRIVIWILFLLTVELFSQSTNFETGYNNLNISADGNRLVYSVEGSSGFYLTELQRNKTVEISTEKGSAYQATWPADGNYILFKHFDWQNGSLYQSPAYYDIKNDKIVTLANPSVRCGTPSISRAGKVAYTVGKHLFITDINGVAKESIKLSSHVNLTPISPDGKFIIYNDKNDRLWKLNIETEEKDLLTNSETGYFGPIWSPDSKHFVASRMDGTLAIIDIENNLIHEVGDGTHPTWTNDGKWLIFSRAEFLFNREILNRDLFAVQYDGNNLIQITSTEDWEDYPTISNNTIYFSLTNTDELISAEITKSKAVLKLSNPFKVNTNFESIKSAPMNLNYNINKSPSVNDIYFDIPYVNQRYDTPDWFNGNWACGATAAIQCIAYFGLVDQWPEWVSTPYSHISDYGNYICEIYTYNGYTFNIGGRDPSGTIGYGGYGYIIKNNWANTKDYMRDYAIIHGLGSAVDWSPKRGELATEINNQDPFVLLNSLTSSGHYISVIGYVDIDTTTVIVNDPYGDKNQGYANFYGRRAHYDWPGYNNGYENLNTVWCFIYFRGDPPADLCALNIISDVDTGQVGQQFQVASDITNIGQQPSIPATVEFFISANGAYDENAFVLGSYNMPLLNSAQVFSISDSIQIPDSLISEIYQLSVFVDSDTLNKEMLKDNNVASRNLVVHGYPRIYSILPEDSSIVTEPRPEIRAKYQDVITRIDTTNVKLFLDDTDITNQCTKATRKISYIPSENLTEGSHNVKVKVPSNFGLTAIENWIFNVQLSSSLQNLDPNVPESYSLAQNYPNPFNPATKINFNLQESGLVNVFIFDLNGKRTTELIKNINYPAGRYQITFDGSLLASGVYFYKIIITSHDQAIKFTDVKKMLLLR